MKYKQDEICLWDSSIYILDWFLYRHKNNLTKLAIVSVYNCIIVEVTHECIFLINGRKN